LSVGGVYGVVAALVTLVAAGCGGRKHKSNSRGSLKISTATLPAATEGVPYSATIEATGGATPYTWHVSGLPSGLTWSQVGNGVVISGTPASGTAGTYDIDVTVTDSSSRTQRVSAKLRLVVNPPGGSTWYVNAVSGSDSNSGTSWTDAFKTIAHALDVAQNGDTIIVADATYHEHDLDFQGKKIHLKSANGPANCIIDCQQQGRAFYFHSGETTDSILEGFTVRNGKVSDTCGGAVLCMNNSCPTITNCVFENNKAVDTNGQYEYEDGGAIDCESSSPTITNCTFSGNSAHYHGGAILCYNSSPTVKDCAFNDNNTNEEGGAIFCYYSNPSIEGCAFNGNIAGNYGGAIFCRDSSNPVVTDCAFVSNSAANYHGGALYCLAGSNPTLTNCTFISNSAGSYGGALCCYLNSSPAVTDCIFSGNSAWDGGAIWADSSDPAMTGCTFISSGADGSGGAIFCSNSNLTLTNCAFSGNSAKYSGGAIFCYSSSPTLSGCTFSANSADNGGAIASNSSSTLSLRNSILWNNSASSEGNEIYIEDAGASCTLNYCCVDNTGYGGQTGNIAESDCIHQDPQFVNPANGDYHLQNTSPCIDAGDNSLVPSGVDKDLDGNQRIVDGDSDGTATVDIGAYEYQP
ncbi:MAG: hypothetical protein DRP63_01750, partial [Planctomycetota bacterium]